MNYYEEKGDFLKYLRKTMRIMRLSLFLIVISTAMAFSANSYSQNTKLTLDLNNATVKEVLKAIENQSEFLFFYQEKHVDLNRQVTLHVTEQEVETILNQLFAGTDNIYVINDRQIVIGVAPRRELEKQAVRLGENVQPVIEQPQQKEVTGKVTDEGGLPLPGVSVIVKGTTIGTVTNNDGEFSLNVPLNAETLQFSFVGMRTQEMPIEGRTTFTVVMEEDVLGIEEVVAIGYGTQKKINLTGAVSQINYENPLISSRPVTNVSSSLAGLSSGMIIRQGDGTPSSDAASIRIRGIGSLNASQNPLVIVDGQPMSINDINPSDIATISVLKDAASAAIYGSRASNGVILVTTKSGKHGEKIRINYTGNIGFLSPTKLTDFISNTADHMTLINQIQQNSGLPAMYSQNRIDEWREKSKTDVLYPNTDWWDVLLKNNSIQNHNISARGGSDRINFYTSMGYMNNNGIIDNTSYERYTFRSNLNFRVNDYLSLGTNLTALLGKADPVSVDQLFIHFDANSPGGLPKYQGRYGATMTGQESPGNNPIAIIENYKGEQNTQKYTGKFFATITPLQGWDINGSYFINMNNYNDWTFLNPYELWDFQTSSLSKPADPNPPLSNSYSKQQNYIIDLYSNYSKTIRNHHLNMMIGYNQEYYKSQNFNATKTGLLDHEVLVLNAATTPTIANGSATDYASRSYFGRVNYNYLEKYLFEVNIRRDGSSRFSPDKRWGTFPSFSGGWRISEESFWNGIEDIVNYFKIRVSWGQLGNNGIGNYEWQDVFQSANYSLSGSIVNGIAPSAIANEIITWETTDILDIGVDFNLFKKFTFSFDYYNKYSHGILAKLPIPYVNGGLSAPRVNSGKVRNTGFDGDIKYDIKIRDFTISAGVNGNINKNTLEKYKGEGYIETLSDGYSAWTEGKPIGVYYVREVDHIVQDETEIDQLIADGWTFKPSTPGVGDFLYKNNNEDKVIDDKDRVLKGNPIPKFTYGGNLSIAYKNIDCYFLFNGVAGWDLYYKSFFNSLDHYVIGYLFPKEYQKSWTKDNPSTSIPKIYSNNTKNDQTSDFFLHKADYLRIKSIQLGYSLPNSLTSKAKINNFRLYVDLENFFTFTSFPGMDPENDGSRHSPTFTYPLMKTISVGINIGL